MMSEREMKLLISLASASFQQGQLQAALECLEEIWEPVERGPFVLLHADACNLLAAVKAESDKEAAVAAAETAYRLAWCDGPPFAYYWGLEKAKELLRSFGQKEPAMPAFDQDEHPPISSGKECPDGA